MYESASGRAVVKSEIEQARLTAYEAAQLSRLVDRIAAGETLKRDTKWLKEYGLWEARLSGDRRIFRLLFAKRSGSAILVGLLFTAKKSDRLPKSSFTTAQQRLVEWDHQVHE